MTASITLCFRRLASRLHAALLTSVAIVLLAIAAPGAAQDARFSQAAIQATDEAYVLEADIQFKLNDSLTEAVERGVALYLVLEIEITRARWYWLDERILRRKRTYRLSYHPITRTYRLTLGSLHQSFDTLGEALRTLERIRNWALTPTDKLDYGQSYDVAVRFRLDTSQLPKPFQLTPIGSRDWSLDTDWLRWTFLATGQASR